MVQSKFTFCDLAGSERIKKSQNPDSTTFDIQTEEARNINTSLTTLGRVILALKTK